MCFKYLKILFEKFLFISNSKKSQIFSVSLDFWTLLQLFKNITIEKWVGERMEEYVVD